MTDSTPSASLDRAHARRIYLFSLVDEIGPLIAVFTLLLADHGISPAQVSTIFTLWAVIGIALEVPSGALADQVDRRRLLAGVIALRGLGIATWLVWPTFTGALVGAALWALHTTASSGTWEALVYDLLATRGDEEAYPVVMARVGQVGQLGTALGALAASGLLALGVSLTSLGWLTVGLQLVPLLAVLSLPAVAPAVDEDDEPADPSYAAWWRTMRAGVRAALGERALLKLVVVGSLLEGLFVLDEYVPLLGRARGASDEIAPLLMMAVWGGLIVGGEVAARRPRLSAPALAVLLGVGVVAAALALASGSMWGVALIGVTYAVMNTCWVLLEARLQERAPAHARATVRSVVAFFAGLVNVALFMGVGVMSVGEDPAPGLLVAVGALGVTAALLSRWLPGARVGGARA